MTNIDIFKLKKFFLAADLKSILTICNDSKNAEKLQKDCDLFVDNPLLFLWSLDHEEVDRLVEYINNMKL